MTNKVLSSAASLSTSQVVLWLLGILVTLLGTFGAVSWKRLDEHEARIRATEVTEAVHGSEYQEILRRLGSIDKKLDK